MDIIQAAVRCAFEVELYTCQLHVLLQLIYEYGDTVLIARTEFEKSFTFQAYAVLINKITLQLIPLSTLGEEHARYMASKGAKTCLITHKIKHENPSLFQE